MNAFNRNIGRKVRLFSACLLSLQFHCRELQPRPDKELANPAIIATGSDRIRPLGIPGHCGGSLPKKARTRVRGGNARASRYSISDCAIRRNLSAGLGKEPESDIRFPPFFLPCIWLRQRFQTWRCHVSTSRWIRLRLRDKHGREITDLRVS